MDSPSYSARGATASANVPLLAVSANVGGAVANDRGVFTSVGAAANT